MKKMLMTAATGAALLVAMFGGAAFGQSATPTPPPLPTVGGIPPPPPPPGAATATPTAAPATATPLPTATSTPVPLTINLKLAHLTLAVNATQKVTVTTLTGASVTITVTYPNRQKSTHRGTGNASGKVTWSFKQPTNRTTSKSRTVSVHAVATANGARKSSTKTYKVK